MLLLLHATAIQRHHCYSFCTVSRYTAAAAADAAMRFCFCCYCVASAVTAASAGAAATATTVTVLSCSRYCFFSLKVVES